MMAEITIVFGKEQVEKVINNIALNEVELTLNQKVYSFETREEAAAFIKGLNEAVGWQELYVLEEVLSDG